MCVSDYAATHPGTLHRRTNRHSCDWSGSIRLCSSASRSCSSYFDWCAFFVYLHLRFTRRLRKRNRSPAPTATKQARVRTVISSETGRRANAPLRPRCEIRLSIRQRFSLEHQERTEGAVRELEQISRNGRHRS